MKFWKKIVLVLFLVAVVSQIPFIYRWRQLAHLRQAIAISSAESHAEADPTWHDYKGVIHVHSSLGGHSLGTLPEIVRAAALEKLDFVMMTEHPSAELDSVAQTLSGIHSGVLFVPGNEVAAPNGDRFLIPLGSPASQKDSQPTTAAIIQSAGTADRPVFIAYPEDYHSWELGGVDGIEVYDLFTDAKQANRFTTIFDAAWGFRSYPDLLFARIYRRPDRGLEIYDSVAKSSNRKLTLFAGNDAHQNVGFGLADSTGKKPLYFQFDPYQRSFSIVRTHVIVKNGQTLDEQSLISALKAGHAYISFDLFGDGTGFSFHAPGTAKTMGDEVNFSECHNLEVRVPVSATVKLYRDGEVVATTENVVNTGFPVDRAGIYRVEVYLPRLGRLVQNKPWIISNPIYVR